MGNLVLLSKVDEIAIITINNPPVNALSPGVPEGILECLDRAAADPAAGAIILIGGGRTFIAGADIREFGKITAGEREPLNLLPVMLAMENSPKPLVCAIHGTAFGGGLEVAMGAHYRVAVPSAQVAQPEVKLGLIPGAGGTQRLPRLAGVAAALEMCAFGEPVGAARALDYGIIDRIVEGELLDGAVSFAREALARGDAPRKTRERLEKLGNAAANGPLFAAAREKARTVMRNQTAPLAAIDAIEAATHMPFEDGCRFERQLFDRCLFSGQSKALIYAFFGEREVSKAPGPVGATAQIEFNLVGPRLLEIVRGPVTSNDGIATAMALAKKLNRVAVVVNNTSAAKRLNQARSPNTEIDSPESIRALAEEGSRLLAEGVVSRGVDIDMILIHGYGFPAHLGGPMFQER